MGYGIGIGTQPDHDTPNRGFMAATIKPPAYVTADGVTLLNEIRKIDATKSVIRWASITFSDLGGPERASLIVKATYDWEFQWQNGIFQNSRYAMFRLGHDGSIELFSSGSGMPRFRKQKVNSLADAAKKIVNYFKPVSAV